MKAWDNFKETVQSYKASWRVLLLANLVSSIIAGLVGWLMPVLIAVPVVILLCYISVKVYEWNEKR